MNRRFAKRVTPKGNPFSEAKEGLESQFRTGFDLHQLACGQLYGSTGAGVAGRAGGFLHDSDGGETCELETLTALYSFNGGLQGSVNNLGCYSLRNLCLCGNSFH